MTFITDIHDPQRMNPNDFGDPDLSSNSNLRSECQLCTIIIAADVHGPRRVNAIDLGDHVAFPTASCIWDILWSNGEINMNSAIKYPQEQSCIEPQLDQNIKASLTDFFWPLGGSRET